MAVVVKLDLVHAKYTNGAYIRAEILIMFLYRERGYKNMARLVSVVVALNALSSVYIFKYFLRHFLHFIFHRCVMALSESAFQCM